MRSALVALLLLGCSSGTDVNAPANITVVTATSHAVDIWADVSAHLRNTGGVGVYRLEFWSGPHAPNGPDIFLGETEAVEVGADYDETLTWRINGQNITLDWILAFSRDPGTAQYRETDRFDF